MTNVETVPNTPKKATKQANDNEACSKEAFNAGCECNHTGMYELLEAIEAAIKSAQPEKRELLARTINAYMNDFPEDYFWAIGPQSPTLLNHIMRSIEPDMSAEGCQLAAHSKEVGDALQPLVKDGLVVDTGRKQRSELTGLYETVWALADRNAIAA
jgi:hypothetical protein